jgi:urease accessory protein
MPARMEIIRHLPALSEAAEPLVRIPVDRLTLAKRRWRGAAEDGREFGFDLEKPMPDGAIVFQDEKGAYIVAQKYEPVLEVQLGQDPPAAAKLGWMIGNLHFPLEVTGDSVRVADDPALRQMFEREGIEYASCKRVFHPLAGGHHH